MTVHQLLLKLRIFHFPLAVFLPRRCTSTLNSINIQLTVSVTSTATAHKGFHFWALVALQFSFQKQTWYPYTLPFFYIFSSPPPPPHCCVGMYLPKSIYSPTIVVTSKYSFIAQNKNRLYIPLSPFFVYIFTSDGLIILKGRNSSLN